MKGIGIDIVEFARIYRVSDREKFVDKILSKLEKKVYKSLKNEKRQVEYLAGRFAMKEALYKSNPVACQNKNFVDFSILNDETGAPYLEGVHEKAVKMTLSHSENYVVAFVIWM